MVRFRTFRNGDPPQLLQLFRQSRPGRAFACPESVHALETAVFSMPYFDPRGLIIAEDEGRIVGFAHGGFGFNSDLSGLDRERGVICCVLVAESHHKRALGRTLVERVEHYLIESGALSFQAGQSRHCDPFYFGVYGGARPSGFLESNPAAGAFFQSLGYERAQRILVFQRDLTDRKDPMNFRLMTLRRQTELRVTDQPESPTFWWYTRFGNIESMRFRLEDKKSHARIATLTVVGLDHYIRAWNERAIGLVDVWVEPGFRGQGYGQTLITEAIRRLRTELITRAEIHIPEENRDAINAVLAASFEQIDVGIVYRKVGAPPPPPSSELP